MVAQVKSYLQRWSAENKRNDSYGRSCVGYKSPLQWSCCI